jgi:hypothetical protein
VDERHDGFARGILAVDGAILALKPTVAAIALCSPLRKESKLTILGRRFQSTICLTALTLGGCSSAGGQLGTLQTQNRSLIEQNKAQLAEIENLKTHAHRLEDKLIDAERELASLARRDQQRDEQISSAQHGDARSLWDASGNEQNGETESADIRKDHLR